eukprot:364192-Rhodomonas_salina.1
MRLAGARWLATEEGEAWMESVDGQVAALSAYPMPGTDVAGGSICLRVCYAMPGTDMVYGSIYLRV